MNKLADSLQLGVVSYGFLDQVFHGFDIMVGGALYFFNAQGLLLSKVFGQAVEQTVRLGGKFSHFGYLGICCQVLQPAHLN